MNQTEALNRRVIELIHGKPWAEAVKLDFDIVFGSFMGDTGRQVSRPVDLSRIMQALESKGIRFMVKTGGFMQCTKNKKYFIDVEQFNWKLLKEDGSTADTFSQEPETINKLLTLLK